MLNKEIMSMEEEESKSENWDFAAPSDDMLDSYLLADTTSNLSNTPLLGAGGILIVGGDATEIHSDDDVGDDLSLPGTESLPTDVGSLADTHDQEESQLRGLFSTNAKRMRWAMALIIMLLFAFLSTSCYALTVWQGRQELATSNELLEAKVGELESQVGNLFEEVKAAKEKQHIDAFKPKQFFELGSEDPGGEKKVLLADNCWFKAELELGDCLNDATDSLAELSSDATKAFQKLFFNGGDDDDGHDAAALFQANAWKAASEATNVVASAAVTVIDSMVSFGKVMDDSVLFAIEQTRDAVEDATLTKYM